ncbi:flippase [Haloarcula sp. CBA1131]|uniref:flippase n=1 Tax=Haloarcula sp. CBA1131 TaxID=1853686 RepID=UPI001247D4FC|nr:flippase [Haloarcula sp. CBA1131]KAA9407017.1 flippase [Haloarcula sp. CBA1131]
MNIAKSSFQIIIAKVVGSLSGFLAIVVFSRELGASPLGTYYPFLALLGMLAIPADFGIRGATEKRISEGNDVHRYLATAILLKLPPLLVIACFLLLIRGYLVQYLGTDLVLPLIVALFIRESGNFSIAVLRGELRAGETAILQIFRPLGWLIVGYFLFMRGHGVHGLVYGYIAGSVAMMIVGWWKVSIRPSKPSVEHARSLLDYGQYGIISSVGGYFYSWMDVAILSVFVGAGIAGTRVGIGAYENAWRISLFAMMVSQAIATTIFPQISRWDAEEATGRIENIIPTAILPALLIVIPAFVGTAILAKDILRILFTPEFVVAWLVLIVLMAEKILQAIHVVLGRSLQAINRPDLAAYATVVAVIINLVLNVILIWQFGIVGAAIATTVSFAANTLLHAYYLNQFINIQFPFIEAAWSTGAASVMGIAVYILHSVMQIQTIIDLFGVVLFGVLVYILVILVSPTIRTRLWNLAGPAIIKRIA